MQPWHSCPDGLNSCLWPLWQKQPARWQMAVTRPLKMMFRREVQRLLVTFGIDQTRQGAFANWIYLKDYNIEVDCRWVKWPKNYGNRTFCEIKPLLCSTATTMTCDEVHQRKLVSNFNWLICLILFTNHIMCVVNFTFNWVPQGGQCMWSSGVLIRFEKPKLQTVCTFAVYN